MILIIVYFSSISSSTNQTPKALASKLNNEITSTKVIQSSWKNNLKEKSEIKVTIKIEENIDEPSVTYDSIINDPLDCTPIKVECETDDKRQIKVELDDTVAVEENSVNLFDIPNNMDTKNKSRFNIKTVNESSVSKKRIKTTKRKRRIEGVTARISN